jgi:hypothetical protein
MAKSSSVLNIFGALLTVVVLYFLFCIFQSFAEGLKDSGYFDNLEAQAQSSQSLENITITLDNNPVTVNGTHAADRGHTEADAIRDACGMSGQNAFQFYIEPDNVTLHMLCVYMDGGNRMIGDWIVKLVKDGEIYQKIEKTVFKPMDGTQTKIVEWLLRKNAVRINPIFK